jgi:hypothetical protein
MGEGFEFSFLNSLWEPQLDIYIQPPLIFNIESAEKNFQWSGEATHPSTTGETEPSVVVSSRYTASDFEQKYAFVLSGICCIARFLF